MKARYILAIWLLALLWLSLSPLPLKLRFHTHGPMHDWFHYLAFLITAVLLWMAAPRPLWRGLVFLGGGAFGFVQEWAENKIYHAGFEAKDVASDIAGLVTGFALMLLISALGSTMHEFRPPHDY